MEDDLRTANMDIDEIETLPFFLGFDFVTPQRLSSGMWEAPPVCAVLDSTKYDIDKSLCRQYDLKRNDIVFDVDSISLKLTTEPSADWNVMKSLYFLALNEKYLITNVDNPSQEESRSLPPKVPIGMSPTTLGIVHVGNSKLKLDKNDFNTGILHIKELYRISTARMTAHFLTVKGNKSVLRVQSQFRRRKAFRTFFPVIQKLLMQRRAATLIQKMTRGHASRLQQAKERLALAQHLSAKLQNQIENGRKMGKFLHEGSHSKTHAHELTLAAYTCRATPLTDEDVKEAISFIKYEYINTESKTIGTDATNVNRANDYKRKSNSHSSGTDPPTKERLIKQRILTSEDIDVRDGSLLPLKNLYWTRYMVHKAKKNTGKLNSNITTSQSLLPTLFLATNSNDGSTAHKLGLTRGDIIYMINGALICGFLEQLDSALRNSHKQRISNDTTSDSVTMYMELSVLCSNLSFPQKVDPEAWRLQVEHLVASAILKSELNGLVQFKYSPSWKKSIESTAQALWLLNSRLIRFRSYIEDFEKEAIDSSGAIDEGSVTVLETYFKDSLPVKRYFRSLAVLENYKYSSTTTVLLKRNWPKEPLGYEIQTTESIKVPSVGWRANEYVLVIRRSPSKMNAKKRENLRILTGKPSYFDPASLDSGKSDTLLQAGDLIYSVDGNQKSVCSNFLKWVESDSLNGCKIDLVRMANIHDPRASIHRPSIEFLSELLKEAFLCELKARMVFVFKTIAEKPQVLKLLTKLQACVRGYLSRRIIENKYYADQKNPLYNYLFLKRQVAKADLKEVEYLRTLQAYWFYSEEHKRNHVNDIKSIDDKLRQCMTFDLPLVDIFVQPEEWSNPEKFGLELATSEPVDGIKPQQFVFVKQVATNISRTHQSLRNLLSSSTPLIPSGTNEGFNNISEVVPCGAERLGFRKDDVVLRISGNPVNKVSTVDEIYAQQKGSNLVYSVICPSQSPNQWSRSIAGVKLVAHVAREILRREEGVWIQNQNLVYRAYLKEFLSRNAWKQISKVEASELASYAALKLQSSTRGLLERLSAKSAIELPQNLVESIHSTFHAFVQSIQDPKNAEQIHIEIMMDELSTHTYTKKGVQGNEQGESIDTISLSRDYSGKYDGTDPVMKCTTIKRETPDTSLGTDLEVRTCIFNSKATRQLIRIKELSVQSILKMAGMQKGDTIIRCDDNVISTLQDLLSSIEGKTTFRLYYLRTSVQFESTLQDKDNFIKWREHAQNMFKISMVRKLCAFQPDLHPQKLKHTIDEILKSALPLQ